MQDGGRALWLFDFWLDEPYASNIISGVGKTEIARHWYGDAGRLVEIDMSEYEQELLVTSSTAS